MSVGRSLTKHFHIESRQHEVFNYDLGEGVPRRQLLFGVFVTLAWFGLMFLVFGIPDKVTFTFYLVPPVVFAYFAYQEDPVQPRRKRLTQWAVRARYMVTGHRPIIALGARAAYRNEYLPLRERVRIEGALRYIAPWTVREAWERDEDKTEPWADGEIRAGSAISLDQTAELIGFDYMQKVRDGGRKGRRR